MDLSDTSESDLRWLRSLGITLYAEIGKWKPPKPLIYPYPIQDWTDKKNYTKKRDTKEWAWEFLRRNKSYQEDYYKFFNDFDFPEFEFFYDDKYAVRHVMLNNHIISLEQAILEKYKLFSFGNTPLHAPLKELPEQHFFRADHSFIDKVRFDPNKSTDEQFPLEPVIPENIVFRLSADKPIKKQINMVENLLLSHRKFLGIPLPKESPRKTKDDDYIKYIRMLDALASKGLMKNSRKPKKEAIEIVETIQPNSTKNHSVRLNDWRDSAFRLVEQGYLDLLEK